MIGAALVVGNAANFADYMCNCQSYSHQFHVLLGYWFTRVQSLSLSLIFDSNSANSVTSASGIRLVLMTLVAIFDQYSLIEKETRLDVNV